MEFYTKGQLSFLILTCLLDRDFYGLDIISEISARSNGKINLKKPSVYSNLTRMEKQGYVSSYLRNSDYGPNRKYYSLTEKGRGFYRELKNYFDYNKIDVFRDFVDVDIQNLTFLNENEFQNKPNETESNIENKMVDSQSPSINENSEQDDDFFDFSSLDEGSEENISASKKQDEESNTQEIKNINEEVEKIKVQENSISETKQETYDETKLNEDKQDYSNKSSFARYSLQNDNNANENNIELTKENNTEEKKDDAVFLPNQNVDEYNKRLFDISKDINKIKRKRSFAEDQIAITVTEPLYYANEKKKANIEDFKTSLLENKNKFNTQNIQIRYKSPAEQTPVAEKKESVKTEPIKNDAILITDRIDSSEVLKARKIEPPKLKIVSENTKDTRLPAPKRDSKVDPSHREILNRLYSKTKDESSTEQRADRIYDYDDLKEFYQTQSIPFDIYHKNDEKKIHNTNKLYLFISLGTLLISILSSVLIYVILLKTNMLNGNTNFLYFLLPLLLLIDVGVKLYNYKMYSSWMPNSMKPQWLLWSFTFLIACIVIGFNLIFGMASNPFNLYGTTLILPLTLLLIVLPARYYATKIVLIKYWK